MIIKCVKDPFTPAQGINPQQQMIDNLSCRRDWNQFYSLYSVCCCSSSSAVSVSSSSVTEHQRTPCLAQSVYQKGRHTYPPTQTINPHFYRFQGCRWWWVALEPNQEQQRAKTPIQSMFTMSMAQELCDKGGQLLILEATVFWLQVYSTLNPWSSLPWDMNFDGRPTEDVCLICITICGRRKDKQ